VQQILRAAPGVDAAQTPVSASSTGAAGAISATLTHATGKTTYLTGFTVTGSGATAASVITVTLAGCAGGTMSFVMAIPAGVTAAVQPLSVSFNPALAAATPSSDIVLSVPTLGPGNTNIAASLWGYQQ
jgi:hypothetical protein